jgi:hypothetical protein
MGSEERKELEIRKEKIILKFNQIVKNKEKWILFSLLAFTILYKLYYFFKTLDQAIWWDEGDYLALAKELYFPMVERPEWWSHFAGMRPLLMPLIWGFMFFIKLGEPSIRFFTLLLPSILSVYLMYRIGKSLYSEKIGLMSAFMLSVYWVHNFYTFRILTDIPAMFFGLLSIYYFWVKYEKEKKNWGLYLSIIFAIIGFSARFTTAFVLVSILIYLLITRGSALFKDKVIWKGAGVGFLIFSPYLCYLIINKFAMFKFYFTGDSQDHRNTLYALDALKDTLNILPTLMETIWFICLIVGLFSLYRLVIGFDLIIKRKEKSLNSDLFLFLQAFVLLSFFIFILKGITDRWLLMLLVPLFIWASKGILIISDFVKKYNQLIGVFTLIFLIFAGAYQQMDHGDKLIENKVSSYQEEKLAGVWLKENTLQGSKILIASIVQNQYYSERQSYDLWNKDYSFPECYLASKLIESEECFIKTEGAFKEKIKTIDADYLVIHVFEPAFTPPWIYTYPQRYPEEMNVVKAYVDDNNNPKLIIYEFNKSSDLFQ